MTVHKMIKFYVLEPQPCWSANGLNSDNLNLATHTIFKSAFPQIDFYDMEFEKKKLFFRINLRKEFFKVNLEEIEQVVKENFNNTVKFTKVPAATEYRQTQEILSLEQ